jgi:CDGSH-type Zn-finger protein
MAGEPPGEPLGEPLAPGDPPGRVVKGPFAARCEPGKYAWCRCQRSKTYPFCDGTHRSLEGSEIGPLKVVFDEACTVIWCACSRTGNPPYCDGTHGRL